MVGKNRDNKRKLVSPSLRYIILKRDGFRCQLCGASSDAVALEVDHILPVAEGGDNDPKNLRALCFDCNRGRVVDINRQPIMKGFNNQNTEDNISQKDDGLWDELFPGVRLPPQIGMVKGSYLFSSHGLKSLFVNPYPEIKPYFDEETGELITDAGYAFQVNTLRENITSALKNIFIKIDRRSFYIK